MEGRLGEWPPGASHLLRQYLSLGILVIKWRLVGYRGEQGSYSGRSGTEWPTQRTNEAGNAHRSGAIRLSNNRPANELGSTD